MWSIVRFDDGCENLFDRRMALLQLLEEGRREFELSSLNTVTSIDRVDGPTLLLYDEWDQRLPAWSNENWLETIKQYREGLTKSLGYWMHSESCTSEPTTPDSSAPSDLEIMAHTVETVFHKLDIGYKLYRKNKQQVEQLKEDCQEEIKAIDQLETRALIEKLQNSEEPLTRGRIIKNLIEKTIDDSRAVSTFIKLAKDNHNLNFVRSIVWILTQTKIEQKSVIKATAALLAQYNDDLVKIAIADYFYDLVVYRFPSIQTLKLIVASSKQHYSEQEQKDRACAYYFCEIIGRCSSSMHYTEFYDTWHNATDILKNA